MGITSAGITINPGNASITITFKSPAALGPGTYSDIVVVGVTLDEAGLEHIANSPITVPITYTVTAENQTFTQVVEPDRLQQLPQVPTGKAAGPGLTVATALELDRF